jgi:DNA-directed RNA polymerase specialized sigma24 family protein
LAKKPNFSNYTYKDEFISDAIIDCLSAVENFDANKTNNPFAYFTQIAWNAFVRRIHKEHKQTYIKHKNYEQLFIINDFYDDNDSIKHKNNELSNEVIKSFEDKIVKIKKIQKKYGLENL